MRARLRLKVRAGARQTQFAGQVGEFWKLQVAAPPVDGKANEAIIRFLAKFAGVPASRVRIVSGASSSSKTVEIEGVDAENLQRAILESHGPRPDSGSVAPRKT
jgi:hypothetical protein